MTDQPKSNDDTSSLSQLGAKSTTYLYDNPSVETLEIFANKTPQRDYVIEYIFPEFTSCCPKTGQPDFARIAIQYIPGDSCIETKSLKLYFFSYRNYGSFMESITNQILTDCVKAADPKWMMVTGEFNPRGGVGIVVRAEHGKQNRPQ